MSLFRPQIAARGRRLVAATAAAAALLALVGLAPGTAAAATTPATPAAVTATNGPVGWNSYRELDQLPYLTDGVSTREYSSFDRQQNNNDAGANLGPAPGGGVLLAAHDGPGEIDSIWMTGSVASAGNLRIVLDGKTVMNASAASIFNGSLGGAFVFPLVANPSQSSGGYYIDVPMPFTGSMQVSTDADPGYYHVNYRTFPNATGVSTFNPSASASDVLSMFANAGSADPKSGITGETTSTGTFQVPAGQSAVVASGSGSGQITALTLNLPSAAEATALASDRIEISFDGTQTVNAPLGEFFGSASDSVTRALMSSINAHTAGTLTSWWPMPYGSGYAITVVNGSSQALPASQVAVTTAAGAQWASDLAAGAAGYFHASAGSGATTPGQDWKFLQASGHGKVVGVVAALDGPSSPQAEFMEGNEHGFIDGSKSPQINGTGTEDYFEGGFYFQNGPFTDPLNGNTSQALNGTNGCPAGTDCYDAYRLLIGDAVEFDSQIDYGIEHGGHDNVQANYSTTTLWYGNGTPAETGTDSIQLGNNASEQAHDFQTDSRASADSLSSAYEGNDGTPAEVTRCVDDSAATETFTLQVNPANQGVVLQRTSDQDASGQSATVSVDGTGLGTWLEPLGDPYHRWLDDGFDVPASVSAGQSSITVSITPGGTWSAEGYQARSILPGGTAVASTTTTRAQPQVLHQSVTAPAATPAATATTPQTDVFTDGNGAIDVGHHADGRVEVFATGSAGGVNSQVETAPEAAWSGWCAYSPPGRVSQIVSAVHQDGRVEEFAVTSSGGIENNPEVAPNGRWAGWAGFGPSSGTVSSVQVARHAGGRIEVFAVMSDGSIQNKFESTPDGSWSGWNSFAPTGAAASIKLGLHSDGRLEVFAISSTGAVRNKFETSPDGAWSGWADFGPAGTVTQLATAVHADGRLEVFAVLSDGSIQNKYEQSAGGTWSGWNDFASAGEAASIAVGTHQSGRLEVFAVSASGAVRNKFETVADGAWSGWADFGPAGTVTRLVATNHADGRMEVLAVLPDGSMQNKYEQTPDGAWSAWNGYAPAGTA